MMTSTEERRVVVWIAFADSHPYIPFVGDVSKVGIEHRAQAADQVRKRVLEVAVLAFAEAVPRHVDVASEVVLVSIERRDGATLPGREASARRRNHTCRGRL